MARNKLSDLNNHLFEQLERLNDNELSNENLDKEIRRAKSMGEVASNIIEINRLSLQAVKMISNGDMDIIDLPSEIDTVKKNK